MFINWFGYLPSPTYKTHIDTPTNEQLTERRERKGYGC